MNLSSFQPEVTPQPRLPVAAWIGLDWADKNRRFASMTWPAAKSRLPNWSTWPKPFKSGLRSCAPAIGRPGWPWCWSRHAAGCCMP